MRRAWLKLSADMTPTMPGSVIPPHILCRLPSYPRMHDALAHSLIDLPEGTALIRAAWNPASIWPNRVRRTYRFGPPNDLTGADGVFPFHWVYAAAHVITAAWEARFCANDATRPGTFFIEPLASEALIARLTFDCPVRLIDLAGASASKLGIFDALASPDHEWCQWFGYMLDQLIASRDGEIDGIRYMSRRHPGHSAFALSSRAMQRLGMHRLTSIGAFKHTAEFSQLQDDPCCVAPP